MGPGVPSDTTEFAFFAPLPQGKGLGEEVCSVGAVL